MLTLAANETKSSRKILSNFKPKGKRSPEKDVNPKTVRKFISKWKIGRKCLMYDENKGMWCSLCAEHDVWFNATFNNISVLSWWSVLLVEENGVPGESH